MEFCEADGPRRSYKIIGEIEHMRLLESITRAQVRTDVAWRAREVGGDAVIYKSSRSAEESVRSYSVRDKKGNWSTIGGGSVIRHYTGYWVIKYVE
jgi:hypothetical protein